MEDGVAFLAEHAEGKGDGTVAQLNVACLTHDIVSVGDDEVGEASMILLKSFRALRVWLS